MKINDSKGDIQTFGDVKAFKTSIDPKNLEFITTLLSSNLYSDPEQSFIREIVSNAWDSHVEAGKTDVPVLVRLKNPPGYGTASITIRDYGTGLSPTRFEEVYCMIGSSTKRETNDYIGGFGIGKYSSLACSNTVYITSYYEGKAYYYVMAKSGNNITTTLMNTMDTTEENGVEITIKSITDLDPYYKALKCITFFPNVYVDGFPKFNGTKVKYFDKFAVASEEMKSKILLGKVLYPINRSFVDRDLLDFISNIETTGIVIKFEVGELDITPNRENIIYNPTVIKVINQRLREAKKEIDDLIQIKFKSLNYTDIVEYYNSISRTTYYDFIDDIDLPYHKKGYRVNSDLKRLAVTYKGGRILDRVESILTLLSLRLPNLKGMVYDDKIYTTKIPQKFDNHIIIKAKNILICQTGTRMIRTISEYLKYNYDGYAVMTPLTLVEFKDYVSKELRSYALTENLVEAVYEHIIAVSKTIDFNTNEDFLKFKEELSAEKVKGVKVEKATIHVLTPEFSRRETLNFKSFAEAVAYIKRKKKGVILTGMEADEEYWRSIAGARGFIVIKARKDMFSALRALNLSCLVDTEWLLKRDPNIIKFATLLREFPTEILLPSTLVSTLTDSEARELYTLVKWYNDKKKWTYYVSTARGVTSTDDYTLHLCKKIKKYLDINSEIKELTRKITYSSIDPELYGLIAMKLKAYKICPTLYERIRNNKLFRILCNKK